MSTRRVAVTGLGVICALGNNTVCTVQALENGLLPPTGNFTVLTQIAIWTWCRIGARPAQVQFALSNSFAFGGLNAVLAFRGPTINQARQLNSQPRAG